MTEAFSGTLSSLYFMFPWLGWCHLLISKPTTGKATELPLDKSTLIQEVMKLFLQHMVTWRMTKKISRFH